MDPGFEDILQTKQIPECERVQSQDPGKIVREDGFDSLADVVLRQDVAQTRHVGQQFFPATQPLYVAVRLP